MKGEQMVARYMLGEVAEQGQAGSPAQTELRPPEPAAPADPPIRRPTPTRSANSPYNAFAVEDRQLFCFRDRGINIAGCTQASAQQRYSPRR